MSEKQEKTPELIKCRELLKELISSIYGYKQIDCYPKDDIIQSIFEIKLRDNDLIAVFKPTQKYLRNFRNIFTYTFMPSKDVQVKFKVGKPDKEATYEHKVYLTNVIKHTIKSFVGEEDLKKIFEEVTLQKRKYHIMTRPLLEIMENYDFADDIPIICKEEQRKKCEEVFNNQSLPEQQENGDFFCGWNLDKFFRNYPETIDECAELIYNLLIDEMLPLFFEKLTKIEIIEEKYRTNTDTIKKELKEKLSELVSRKLSWLAKQSTNIIKTIILVDPEYNFDVPEMNVLYVPERSPLLCEWHIPVLQYIKYQKPDLSNEDVKTFTSHFRRGVPYPFEMIHPDQDILPQEFPVTNKSVKYRQSMFQDFQITYLTFEKNGRFSPSLFEYLGFQDDYITADIKIRDKYVLAEYWNSVFESLDDVLSRIFRYSSDFVSIIKEVPLPDRECVYNEKRYKDYQEYITKYPEQKISGINSWLEMFEQPALLKKDVNIFSALLPQDQLIRHYLIQWEGANIVYKDMMGEDFVVKQSTKQLAYIIIPLIGDFVSALEENAKVMTDAFKTVIPKASYENHAQKIKAYASDANLESAITQWDESYQMWKRRNEERNKGLLTPDDDLLGLRRYAESNGNLFKNLKDALMKYHSFLK